jgi:RNA polymerase sigma-70 factor (ECF subfamily)
MEDLMVESKRDLVDSFDDEKLIFEAKKGNLFSFEKLVKRYQKKIYYLAYRMTKDHDAADDIAQETFIKAYYSLQKFKEGYGFFPWIYRICMNLSINYLKRRKFVISESMISPQMERKEAVGFNPLDILIKEEKRIKIENAIEKLPPPFKAVFVLKIYEDLSYEDIARALNISKGTVMSRLFRARERLIKELRGDLN